MEPRLYEEYVASLFSQMGYDVKLSPLSNDWGIDVIAIKGNEKIGVQTKMYGGSTRSVNRRVIMELYGAAAYQDCSKAVLATDGEVMPDALQVADKLGIEILHTDSNPVWKSSTKTEQKSNEIKDSVNPSFDEVWKKYIMPLKGKTLYNSRGSNRIVDVDWTGVKRVTSTGNSGRIDIEGFKLAYNTLLRQGLVTREYINQQVDKRCSSGIVLILAQLPFVETTISPTGLKLK